MMQKRANRYPLFQDRQTGQIFPGLDSVELYRQRSVDLVRITPTDERFGTLLVPNDWVLRTRIEMTCAFRFDGSLDRGGLLFMGLNCVIFDREFFDRRHKLFEEGIIYEFRS